jgi:beta-lactamase superfamily II metal-dependent hydrolase
MLLLSGDQTVLVDGSTHPFSLLESMAAALPFQARTIDLAIVTDPRAGNVTGLEEVLRHYHVAEVLDVGTQYPSATYARWRSTLRKAAIPAYRLRTGAASRIGDVQLTALGPDGLYPDPKDSVGLLRVSSGGRSVLLAGAASQREQQEALFRPVRLHADVLLLDGSSGCDRHFLRAVHPRLLLTQTHVTGPFNSRTLEQGQPFAVDL